MAFLTRSDLTYNQARELLADEVRGDQLYHALCDKLTPLADAAQTLLLALRGTGVAIKEREEFLHALQATLAVNNDAFTGEDFAKMLPGGVEISAALRDTVAGMIREMEVITSDQQSSRLVATCGRDHGQDAQQADVAHEQEVCPAS